MIKAYDKMGKKISVGDKIAYIDKPRYGRRGLAVGVVEKITPRSVTTEDAQPLHEQCVVLGVPNA